MWEQVSEAYRESKKWMCEDCNVKLSDDKYYLHVHHIDGNITHNNRKNFQALCVLCHSLEHKNKINSFLKIGLEEFIDTFNGKLNVNKIREFRKIK